MYVLKYIQLYTHEVVQVTFDKKTGKKTLSHSGKLRSNKSKRKAWIHIFFSKVEFQKLTFSPSLWCGKFALVGSTEHQLMAYYHSLLSLENDMSPKAYF